VIRVLLRRRMPRAGWLQRVFHPDPDRLADLQRALDRSAGDPTALSNEFSEVVSSIRVGSTWKLTGSNRLQASAETLARRLGRSHGSTLRFLDVGASDGITTLETVRHLRDACRVAVEAWMLDLYADPHCFEEGILREYRMSDGSPVMLRAGPLGLQLSSLESTRDPLARWIGRRYLARASRPRMREIANLGLVNPLVRQDGSIQLVRADIQQRCAELVDRFDAVRASNILNLNYFTPAQIQTALFHLHAYVHEGGLLVVSRNHVETDGIEHGSIWRRRATFFERLEDFGGGSYVAAAVDEFRAPAELRA
jgi:hypothetical protein